MKHLAPQHEFDWGPEPFTLVAETTQDGERVKREAEQRERDRQEGESRQLEVVS
jgi:hypothetical protein